MGMISTIKQMRLFYKLKDAIYKVDIPQVEKYLKQLEKEIVNGIPVNDEKVKIEIFKLLGMGCALTKRYKEAESLFLNEIALLEKGKAGIELFKAQSNLSEVYFRQGLFKDATKHYLQALNLDDKINSPHETEIHLTLRGLVISYMKQKLFKEAEPYARRELALRENLNCSIIDSVADLSYICFELERYEEAEVFFVKALIIVEEKMLNADKKMLANLSLWKEDMLEHLVDTYTSLFQFDKAQIAFQKLKAFNPHTEFSLPFCKINSSEESLVDLSSAQNIAPIKNAASTINRNDLCQCGSGKKYKKCHGR